MNVTHTLVKQPSDDIIIHIHLGRNTHQKRSHLCRLSTALAEVNLMGVSLYIPILYKSETNDKLYLLESCILLGTYALSSDRLLFAQPSLNVLRLRRKRLHHTYRINLANTTS